MDDFNGEEYEKNFEKQLEENISLMSVTQSHDVLSVRGEEMEEIHVTKENQDVDQNFSTAVS